MADVEMASTSAEPVASTSVVAAVVDPTPAAPAVTPGRRAKLTEEALLAASRKVIKVLTPKAMGESFVEIEALFTSADVYGPEEGKQQFESLMNGLREMVEGHYSKGIPVSPVRRYIEMMADPYLPPTAGMGRHLRAVQFRRTGQRARRDRRESEAGQEGWRGTSESVSVCSQCFPDASEPD